MAKSIETPILNIAYEESGNPQGFPIVLLHGFPDDIHAWDDVVPPLAKAGHRVLAPYLRGYGPASSTRFSDAAARALRMAEQAAIGQDLIDFADALKLPRFAVSGFDWGGRAAGVAAALHPDRVRAAVLIAGYSIQNVFAGLQPTSPEAEKRIWYQYYFNTERGRAGLKANRRSLCRLLWQDWSPTWHFTDETYNRTAPSAPRQSRKPRRHRDSLYRHAPARWGTLQANCALRKPWERGNSPGAAGRSACRPVAAWRRRRSLIALPRRGRASARRSFELRHPLVARKIVAGSGHPMRREGSPEAVTRRQCWNCWLKRAATYFNGEARSGIGRAVAGLQLHFDGMPLTVVIGVLGYITNQVLIAHGAADPGGGLGYVTAPIGRDPESAGLSSKCVEKEYTVTLFLQFDRFLVAGRIVGERYSRINLHVSF